MIDRTSDGRAFKILNIIDEYTRECLAMLVALGRMDISNHLTGK